MVRAHDLHSEGIGFHPAFLLFQKGAGHDLAENLGETLIVRVDDMGGQTDLVQGNFLNS